MEEYNPSAEGNEPDNRAEELKRFKMTPGIEEARAAINERFELYGALSLLNQAIESLEPFGRIAQQQLDEMEGRRDRVIARLKELREANEKATEYPARMNHLLRTGNASEMGGRALLLALDGLITGDSCYIDAVRRKFVERKISEYREDEEAGE